MAFGQLKPQGHHQHQHHHHHSEMTAKVATDGGHDKDGENVAKPTKPSKPVSWLQSADQTDKTVKHQKDGHLVSSRDEVVAQSPNKIASVRPHGKLLKGCRHSHPDIVLSLSGRMFNWGRLLVRKIVVKSVIRFLIHRRQVSRWQRKMGH
jgi:hypothetical protein